MIFLSCFRFINTPSHTAHQHPKMPGPVNTCGRWALSACIIPRLLVVLVVGCGRGRRPLIFSTSITFSHWRCLHLYRGGNPISFLSFLQIDWIKLLVQYLAFVTGRDGMIATLFPSLSSVRTYRHEPPRNGYHTSARLARSPARLL